MSLYNKEDWKEIYSEKRIKEEEKISRIRELKKESLRKARLKEIAELQRAFLLEYGGEG